MSKRFLRNTMFGTITALSTTLGGFFVSLIVARLLGVAQTGTYTFALWVIATVTTLSGVGLPFTLTRYLPEVIDRSGTTSALQAARFFLTRSTMLNILPLVAACGGAIWLVMSNNVTAGQPASLLHDPLFWILVGLCCSAQAISDYAKGYLRGMHSLDRVATLSSIGIVLQITFVAACTVLFGVRGSLVGYLIGVVVPSLALLDLRGVRSDVQPDLRRRLVGYSRYRWLSELAGAIVFARIEIFFLQVTSNATQVGLLAAALILANLAAQGPIMLTWGLLPHLSEQYSRKDMASLEQTYLSGTRLMAFMVFPTCFGLAAILPAVLPLLYGPTFEAAVPAAIMLVIAASFTATALIGSNVIWAMERSDMDLYFGLAGVTSSLVVGLPLIMRFGLMGAVAARIVTQVLVMTLATICVVRTMRFRFPIAGLVRLFCAAAICAVAARCTLLVMGGGGLAIAVAIMVGALTYVAAVSLLGALEQADVRKLGGMFRGLPAPFGVAAQRILTLAFE